MEAQCPVLNVLVKSMCGGSPYPPLALHRKKNQRWMSGRQPLARRENVVCNIQTHESYLSWRMHEREGSGRRGRVARHIRQGEIAPVNIALNLYYYGLYRRLNEHYGEVTTALFIPQTD